jgi:DNA helicase-2/ATP-dependent DNA helicase PcrA
MLIWGSSLDRAALAADGHEVVDFSALGREIDVAARRALQRRTSLANPAEAWLNRVAAAGGVAILGVRLANLDDLRVLHGYVLEPALRSATAVAIECEQRLTRLAPEQFVDPQFGYPYTLERALDAAMRLFRDGGERLPEPSAVEAAAPDAARLDAWQRRAVAAREGVVQVIAPAGSGKTAVLIERVRELRRRGVPDKRILCTTFNRDARVELQERLAAAGVGSVAARTFHSVGWWLLREERLARRGGPRELSFNQWKRLCATALREVGEWIDPSDARAAIGAIKLGELASPEEFRGQADRRENGPTLARIYELYERHLAEQQIHDFDDLVLLAVRALRCDAELRRRWQARFRDVLVDEYQDIEPAQELLVRILAAPQDCLFCVGDEDQTLYGWRRASVRRMVDLDLAYPGLERHSLAHNYRCPPQVVAASRRLIERNEIRFPKQIEPDPARPPGGEDALALHEHASQADAAAEIASTLQPADRDQIVVLARTTNLLRTVALACAQLGVRVAAPEAVFEPHGARGALEAYVRLCAAPRQAEPNDLALVCRTPSRGLPLGAQEGVAGSLRAGLSFSASLAAVSADARVRLRLQDAGRILDALAAIPDARPFVSYLRGPGGLDEYFTAYEAAFGDTEKVELEALEQAHAEAAGKTVAEYAELLSSRRDALRAIRDDAGGIELTTIHRAKGRQWPQVHVFACEEQQLPHRRALEVDAQQRAAGEGIEAERRLAYVAFTRAQQRLVLHAAASAASRFVTEAGLTPTQPFGAPARQPDRPSGRGRRVAKGVGNGPVAGVLREAERVGLAYALRTAPSRTTALVAAATAAEQNLIGLDTASGQMTVPALLAAIETINDAERAALLAASGTGEDPRPIARLGASARRRLARALRRQASAPAPPAHRGK